MPLIGTRQIGTMTATVTEREAATDTATITKHPVQAGTPISDHMIQQPAELSLDVSWADTGTPLPMVYQQLLDMQKNKVLSTVVTGKRIYNNMAIGSIANTTDYKTNSILKITLSLQEVITADVVAVKVPPRKVQKTPAKTQPAVDTGAKTKKTSSLKGLKNALGSLF